MPRLNLMLCECRNAGVLDSGAVQGLSESLKERGLEFHTVGDLCELAAQRDPLAVQMAGSERATVLACHARAVRWLFAAAGAPLRTDARLFDLRAHSAEPRDKTEESAGASPDAGHQPSPLSVETILTAVLEGSPAGNSFSAHLERSHTAALCKDVAPAGAAASPMSSPGVQTAWDPWFPVIDFERCTNCLQCLSFCLFGVYGVGQDQRVTVRAPENCKTNCPACARVCPETAIIFPKHKAAPINGALVPSVEGERVKVDISSLLGGDVYSRLRSRTQPRFSKDRDPEKALRERQHFLAKLVEAGDISPEFLTNIPGARELLKQTSGSPKR